MIPAMNTGKPIVSEVKAFKGIIFLFVSRYLQDRILFFPLAHELFLLG